MRVKAVSLTAAGGLGWSATVPACSSTLPCKFGIFQQGLAAAHCVGASRARGHSELRLESANLLRLDSTNMTASPTPLARWECADVRVPVRRGHQSDGLRCRRARRVHLEGGRRGVRRGRRLRPVPAHVRAIIAASSRRRTRARGVAASLTQFFAAGELACVGEVGQRRGVGLRRPSARRSARSRVPLRPRSPDGPVRPSCA